MRTLVTLAALTAAFFLVVRPQTVTGPEATGDCVPLDRFHAENPGATAEEIYEAEQCLAAHARATGRSGRNTGFLGNTYDRPSGALAHYRFAWDTGHFTVFEDRIESDDGDGETIVPMSEVSEVSVRGSQLRVDYADENGRPKHLGVVLASDDDVQKKDGARDIDRLRDLIEAQRAGY